MIRSFHYGICCGRVKSAAMFKVTMWNLSRLWPSHISDVYFEARAESERVNGVNSSVLCIHWPDAHEIIFKN